ncbi:hypothetical protein Enr13x_47290 [Stieleria neptunia]|uniref:FHA domain-containing protein n=1 Tax=Stieleria neptunia TaxID=2527979 RepID=A0A518HVI4_9BACT|nr:hypothetical protein [Stieleria neptunia]QDV44858.1 hypothetical protein Enr13x_47290 [Stieleria neptunia]
MNETIRPTTEPAQTSAWRLWIDRCGGFALLAGDRLAVGGARPDSTTDIQVRTDWRRREGTLVRRNGDYFWTAAEDEEAAGRQDSAGRLLVSDSVFPISGSATLRLHQPSPLSRSAVLSLDPPHRFDQHIDQILLVDQTILIGPSVGDHIRCTAVDTAAVLVIRDQRWQAKLRPGASTDGSSRRTNRPQPVDLVPGRRVSIGELDMMLEEV